MTDGWRRRPTRWWERERGNAEADLWNRDYLDLVEAATMSIEADGHGEIACGAMQAGLNLESGRTMVCFTWAGFDEMDELNESGSAELQDGDSLEIEVVYHYGEKAVLKAVRAHSSTTCHVRETERYLDGTESRKCTRAV